MNKTYEQLIQDLEDASIALRYCLDPAERTALASAKLAAERAINAYEDAKSDQDLG